MSYTVIKAFNDLQDSRYHYNVGDIYPRNGAEASEERITELSTDANKLGEPLIIEKPKRARKRKAEASEE